MLLYNNPTLEGSRIEYMLQEKNWLIYDIYIYILDIISDRAVSLPLARVVATILVTYNPCEVTETHFKIRYLKCINFKHNIKIHTLCCLVIITWEWMLEDLIDGKWTLI